jgi:hypothetical protein
VRSLISTALLLVAVVDAAAQTPAIDRIDIRTIGTYTAELGERTPDKNIAGGVINSVRSYKFVKLGTTVSGQKGVHFGFEFVIVGRPDGAKVPLKAVVIFPPPGLRDPETGRTQPRDEYMISARINAVQRNGYGFDHEWEAVPGTWTIQLWDGNRKLAEQNFTIVRP